MSQSDLPPSEPRSSPAIPFLAVFTVCYLVSFIGAEGAIRGLGDWYVGVRRPTWTPPNWAFAPIWTLLYGLMAVAVWQVVETKFAPVKRRTSAVFLFVAQLLLGALWPWLFFAMHQLLLALVECTLLALLTGLTVWSFARVKAIAAWTLVPYWIWTVYATCLCFAIYRQNK